MTDLHRTELRTLREFPFWEEPEQGRAGRFGFTDGIIPDDTQVVVDSDLRVVLPDTRVPLASDRRSDWALFCQERFGIQSRYWPRFTRHPLNTGFTWDPIGGATRVLSPGQVRQYNDEGYVVLEDVLEQGFLDELTRELDANDEARLAALKRNGDDGSALRKISFSAQPSKRKSAVRKLATLPVLQHLAHDLIGPDVRLYWDQSVYKPARCSDPFPWHQDTGYTYVDYEQCFTVWIALTDARVDTGCVRVLPGGHRVGTLLHQKSEFGNVMFDEDPNGMVPVPLRAGSLVAFAATLPHMTGANEREWKRKAVMLEYAPDGMHRIAVDPWGNKVKTPADHSQTQFRVLKDGAPTRPSLF